MKKLEFAELSIWIRNILEEINEFDIDEFGEGDIVDITDFYEPGEKEIETGVYVTFKNGQKLKLTVKEMNDEKDDRS